MYPEIPGRNGVADQVLPLKYLFKSMFTAQVIKIFSKTLQSWIEAHISQIAAVLLQDEEETKEYLL